MTRTTIYGLAVAFAAIAIPAAAQTKTIPVKTEIITAKVEAIDSSLRQVTMTKQDGTKEVLYVPSSVKRFDTLKVGDTITAKYYENLILKVKAPGEPDVDTASTKTTPSDTAMAGTMAHQRTITATISAIDPNVPSITFIGPRDWKYSSKVNDKAALAKVKVGDKVDITWTEAMVLSID